MSILNEYKNIDYDENNMVVCKTTKAVSPNYSV